MAFLRNWIDKATFTLISVVSNGIVVYWVTTHPENPVLATLLGVVVNAVIAWIGVESSAIPATSSMKKK